MPHIVFSICYHIAVPTVKATNYTVKYRLNVHVIKLQNCPPPIQPAKKNKKLAINQEKIYGHCNPM